MASEELTTGGMKAPDAERQKLAATSMAYNTKMFQSLFGGDIEKAFKVADEARAKAEKLKESKTTAGTSGRARRSTKQSTPKTDAGEPTPSKEEKGEGSTEAPAKELTAEEIEKRRIRNAKKRAKQKAKKAAASEAS